MTTQQKADKLDAAADWFTDCKTLTLDTLPAGLIEALRDGATALRSVAALASASRIQAPETTDQGAEPLALLQEAVRAVGRHGQWTNGGLFVPQREADALFEIAYSEDITKAINGNLEQRVLDALRASMRATKPMRDRAAEAERITSDIIFRMRAQNSQPPRRPLSGASDHTGEEGRTFTR